MQLRTPSNVLLITAATVGWFCCAQVSALSTTTRTSKTNTLLHSHPLTRSNLYPKKSNRWIVSLSSSKNSDSNNDAAAVPPLPILNLEQEADAPPTSVNCPKTEKETKFLASTLKTNVLFQDVPKPSLQQMVDSFERVKFEKGSTIVRQGDATADFMLVIGSGECSISIDGEELPDPYGTMTNGSMLGELALLYNSGRLATVKAKTDVEAFKLNKSSFKYFMNQLPTEEKDIKKELRSIDLVIDQIAGVKTKYGGDIIRKFKPSRGWLWCRWSGTILQQTWKGAIANMLLSVGIISAVRHYFQPTWAIGMIPDPTCPFVQRTVGLSKLWHYLMTLTTFILTFFLSQAYAVWKNMYSITRKIQGRMNDIGLLVASTVERDHKGRYTADGEALLDDVADYSRLFHAFMWAQYAKKFQVLRTNRGVSRMLSRGIITRKQYNTLCSLNGGGTQGYHNACIMWILIKCLNGMKSKTLPNDHALRDMLFHEVADLRGTYASIGDLLDGRIPLAYAHFVQILVDSFLLLAPFALYGELGIWCVPAVGLLTLFYSGLLDLAKILLDPLDNDLYFRAFVNMDIGVLIRESNAGSTRWKYGAESLPFATAFWDNR